MFPAVSTADLAHYDFFSKENENKWKGVFIDGLTRVSQKRGYAVQAKADAFEYLERLILQLLGIICSRNTPHSVQDVQERILKLFPPPIDKWVRDEATSAIKQGKKKADLVFPVDKIHSLLQKDVFQYRLDNNVTLYIAAVLEYIASDILQLVGNYVMRCRQVEFSTQDIKAAMACDKVLCELFKLGNPNAPVATDEQGPINTSAKLNYNEVAEDFLQSERQYLRDLQMLIKVFRDELANNLEHENENLESVFASIQDITELTITLISTVEDYLEMTDTNHEPAIGICFLELAENFEFDVYHRYAEAFNESCRQGLSDLLSKPDVEATMSTAGHGFVEAVKFYFPKLLLEPFFHCMLYFDYIKILSDLSPCEKDKSDFWQADSSLTRLKSIMEKLLPNVPRKSTGDLFSRVSGKANKNVAMQKAKELKGQIEDFNEIYQQTYFNEFYYDGELQKISSSKRLSERHVYLFDGYMFSSKYRRGSVVPGATQYEYKLKEQFIMSKTEVRDKEDTDEFKNMFEVVTKDQPPVVYSCRNYEEKAHWMGLLVMLTTKSMLDRILDRILTDDAKKHPLKLPSVDKYRFSEEDSENNIVFDKDNGTHSVIKGGTLLKLVEKLTYHQYVDPAFINTFLTTYRSFCSPSDFLDLLIERYRMPDPEFKGEDVDDMHERKMHKRFRKEYARPVKLRTLNVMKQWVMHHYYDFERDPSLQDRLELFLDSIDETNAKSIVESVRRSLKKAAESMNPDFERSFAAVRSPPPIEYHLAKKGNMSEWNILTLHPIELARQLTLIEFDLYRIVKPSELVGCGWTKKNKDQTSPNLLKMIKHTTKVTRWFEKTIVDTKNFDERVAVYSRILEIMMVFQELNNFNGVLAVVSAMGSASVHRLYMTRQAIPQRLLKALDEARDLQNDHYKKYQERLRSINPPCVPFFGMYLTNILHIEEGNKDFLPNSIDLINFNKRRKVAEITSEIRQFQYSHYCLSVDTSIRDFIEKLQPFESDLSESEMSNYLFERSLEVEPRDAKQPPRFPKRWPDLNLKSPGIKPKHLPGKSYPGPLGPFSSIGSSGSVISLPSSISKMTMDDQDEVLSSTPKNLTPSSVHSTTSPTHTGNSDHSIFVPVMLGMGPSAFNLPQSPAPQAPPLPPRRRIEHPQIDCSSPLTREAPSPPPPLPPRRISPRTPNPPIPRRNSTAANDTPTGLGLHSTHYPGYLPSSAMSYSSFTAAERLNANGPLSMHSNNSPNGHVVHYELEHSTSAFTFDATHPGSPLRTPPRPPVSIHSEHSNPPPQLPPRPRPIQSITSTSNQSL